MKNGRFVTQNTNKEKLNMNIFAKFMKNVATRSLNLT